MTNLNIQKYNDQKGTKGFLDLTNLQIDLLRTLYVPAFFQKNAVQENPRLTSVSFPDQNGTNGLGRWTSSPFSKKADRILHKPGLRASVLIISNMDCAYVTRDDSKRIFHFGIYNSEIVSVDHLISRRKMFYGIVKGITVKRNINSLSNLRLARSSVNKSKGEISRYLKMKGLNYCPDHLERCLITLREFLGCQSTKDEDGKQIFSDLDPEFKMILDRISIPRDRLLKLTIWYKVHQILKSPFYQENESSLFCYNMILKNHIGSVIDGNCSPR